MKDSRNLQSPGEMNKMDAYFTETLEEFMGSALVTWVSHALLFVSIKVSKQISM